MHPRCIETVGGYVSYFPGTVRQTEWLFVGKFMALRIETYGVDVARGYRISRGIYSRFA